MPISDTTYTVNLNEKSLKLPRTLRGKTASEIITYMRSHYRTNREGKSLNVSSAYWDTLEDAVFAPGRWKDPSYVVFPFEHKEAVKACFIWFHGCDPVETGRGVYSSGYACW